MAARRGTTGSGRTKTDEDNEPGAGGVMPGHDTDPDEDTESEDFPDQTANEPEAFVEGEDIDKEFTFRLVNEAVIEGIRYSSGGEIMLTGNQAAQLQEQGVTLERID